MTTSIFTVAANLTTANLTPAMNTEWRMEFEPQLNNAEDEINFLPSQPCCEGLALYNETLVRFVKTAAVLGSWAAEKLHHDPYAPHLPATARPGASVFYFDSPEAILEAIDPEYAVVTDLQGPKGVRIFTVAVNSDYGVEKVIGTNKTSVPIKGETYKMVSAHGSLLPQGKAEEKEEATNFITFVFTYEGPDIGWVLATAHPGTPDPTPKLDGLKEGDVLSYEDLDKHNFIRVIPN